MTTPTAPFFSVLVANHNHADLVCRAVDSVLSQDYPADRREAIVVDDGSTDDSRDRLRAYAGTPGVVVIEQANRGQTGAFVAALQRARGDYICLLDSDDSCVPTKLAALAAHIATLRVEAGNLFLCHDLNIIDARDGQAIADTWFDVVGLRRMGALLHVSVAAHAFPFAVTSGMVFGRALLQEVADRSPAWEWPMGTDGVWGQAALLMAGEVHYVHQPLGNYLVHENNNAASLVGGRYQLKPVWQNRTARLLRFLELLVDRLPLSETERQHRLGYLGRLEHLTRVAPQGRRHAQPLVSFVVNASAENVDREWVAATAEGLVRQTEPHVELIWICTDPALTRMPPDLPGRLVGVASGAGAYARMQAGVRAATGGYLCFLDAGDVPEARFVERHLHTHRFGALPMLTACDMRLLDTRGAVLHAGIMGTAAGWGGGAAGHVGSFSGLLRDWQLAPLAAMVLRRTPLLDAFFGADALPLPDRQVGWLLCQYLLQMGGATRLAENLMDLRLPAHATANPSWLVQFIDRHGPLPAPEYAAGAEMLFAAYARATPRDRSYLSDGWEARFVRWLLQSGGGDTATRIEREARRQGDPAWVARIVAALRAGAAAR